MWLSSVGLPSPGAGEQNYCWCLFRAFPRHIPAQNAVLDVTFEFPADERQKIDSIFVYRCWIWWSGRGGAPTGRGDVGNITRRAGSVLVHCALGLSRSALVVAAGCYVTDIVKPLMKRLVIFEQTLADYA